MHMTDRRTVRLRLLAAPTLLALAAVGARAQVTEALKPVAPECAGNGVADGGPTPEAPTLDEWINLADPSLGFTAATSDVEKSAGEACNLEETPLPPEDYYEKADAWKPLAQCASPLSLTAVGGVQDAYALPYDAANLTGDIMAAAGITNPNSWVGFDSDHANRHFGHRFDLSFTPYFGYLTGVLTIRLRPISDVQSNDTLSLWVPAPPGTPNPPRGWGAKLVDLGVSMEPGHETILQLDLRTLQTGTSTILADINRFQALNVYVQDDMSIDFMQLDLACNGTAVPAPLVGVIMGQSGCGSAPAYDVFLDNEDRRNANNRGGWIGATVSNKNTQFRVCAVDGRLFTPAADAGANFALLALSPTCPAGFTRFDRFHDNEDNRPASWDNLPGGSPTYTSQPQKNTNMAFCVATGSNPAVTNAAFPVLAKSYGVFGGRTAATSRWALERGFVYLDDEDNRNVNAPASPPAYTREFLVPGSNTTYFLARVR